VFGVAAMSEERMEPLIGALIVPARLAVMVRDPVRVRVAPPTVYPAANGLEETRPFAV
jgi:hypothetical protein